MEYRKPTKAEVKRHWQAQEPSFFRPYGARDPGHTILNTKAEVIEIVSAELEGEEVEVFKAKTPAIAIEDPYSRVQSLIRWYHRANPSKDEFSDRVEGLLDHQLLLLLYGDMKDRDRSHALNKFAGQVFEAQKHQERMMLEERKLEQRKVEGLRNANSLRMQMLAEREQLAKNEEVRKQLTKKSDD